MFILILFLLYFVFLFSTKAFRKLLHLKFELLSSMWYQSHISLIKIKSSEAHPCFSCQIFWQSFWSSQLFCLFLSKLFSMKNDIITKSNIIVWVLYVNWISLDVFEFLKKNYNYFDFLKILKDIETSSIVKKIMKITFRLIFCSWVTPLQFTLRELSGVMWFIVIGHWTARNRQSKLVKKLTANNRVNYNKFLYLWIFRWIWRVPIP